MTYLKLLPPVCEKLQEEENLSSYLWLSMSRFESFFLLYMWILDISYLWFCHFRSVASSFRYVKSYKKSESFVCAVLHVRFEASSLYVNILYLWFSISDLLLLLSCMWKDARRVNLSYILVVFFISHLKLLPVCEKSYKKSESLIDACCFPFQIRSFFLYVKNCKSDIWYGTLQCVICIPLFFVCLLEHEGEKSDSLGSTHIIIESCSVWLKILVLWDLAKQPAGAQNLSIKAL